MNVKNVALLKLGKEFAHRAKERIYGFQIKALCAKGAVKYTMNSKKQSNNTLHRTAYRGFRRARAAHELKR